MQRTLMLSTALLWGIATAALADSQGVADSTRTRETRFAAFRAGRPASSRQIARIRARTAASVAAASPMSAADAPPRIWRTATAGSVWDAVDLPEMVVVPAGEFTMGSRDDEPHRGLDEGPLHRVRIGYAFAVSKYAVTVAEFARFVASSGYDAGNSCKTYEHGQWDEARAGRNWRNPGYAQSAADPVVCVDWNDANAYAAWATARTGRHYRLLSEAEYEYANRAGTVTAYWWGEAIGGNHAVCDACETTFANTETAPVGSLPPNPFGLYDTTGNAWSWLADCWNPTYEHAPSDGSANLTGDCSQHAERGGAWFYVPGHLRSAIRSKDPARLRNYHNGFRVAFTL